MSISNPLFITFIFSLLAPKSSTISLKEFFEGVIILLIFLATLFCIFKNEYHLYLESLYKKLFADSSSNLKSFDIG